MNGNIKFVCSTITSLTNQVRNDRLYMKAIPISGDGFVQKYTIYDIAKLADVSASTVSRVINNHPYVRKATREHVLDVLREYNYIPDEAARSLVTQTSKIIGFMISDIRTTHHTDAIFYLERELAKRGYCCIILNTGNAKEDQVNYIKVLNRRNVDAAILIGSIYQSEGIRQAIQQYLPTTPVMMFNGYLEAPNIYGLLADEKGGVYSGVRLMARKNHRHLAFVVDHRTPSNDAKQEGFVSGMRKFCGGIEPVIVDVKGESDGAYGVTVRLLDDYPEVDGIIYAEDLLAVAGIRALTDMHLSIPDSVSVMGINNSLYAENSIPTLTSLDNMLYDMSKTLVRNLLFIQRKRDVEHRIMLPTRIVEREST